MPEEARHPLSRGSARKRTPLTNELILPESARGAFSWGIARKQTSLTQRADFARASAAPAFSGKRKKADPSHQRADFARASTASVFSGGSGKADLPHQRADFARASAAPVFSGDSEKTGLLTNELILPGAARRPFSPEILRERGPCLTRQIPPATGRRGRFLMNSRENCRVPRFSKFLFFVSPIFKCLSYGSLGTLPESTKPPPVGI